MSELVETALRRFLQSRPDPGGLSPLPSFKSGGALVDVADREAPLPSDGRALMFVADTNMLVHAADEQAPDHARCRVIRALADACDNTGSAVDLPELVT